MLIYQNDSCIDPPLCATGTVLTLNPELVCNQGDIFRIRKDESLLVDFRVVYEYTIPVILSSCGFSRCARALCIGRLLRVIFLPISELCRLGGF